MLAKIRIQWWRETVEGLANGVVRRHDITEELAAAARERPELLPTMSELADRYDDIADDHLHEGGHSADASHAARHVAAEAAGLKLGARALVGTLSTADEQALVLAADAAVARAAEATDLIQRWSIARGAVTGLNAEAWPAIAHLAVANTEAALDSRWRVFKAVLLRRLPRD